MTMKRKDSNGRVLKENERQRPNGTYEYRIRLKNGNRKSIYADNLEELRTRERELENNICEGISVDTNNVTLNDMFELWKTLKKGLKNNTFHNYVYMYTKYAQKDIGGIKVNEIKRSDIKVFYNKLASKKGLKVNTIDCVHSCIHQILEMAVDDDYIRYNPADKALKELKQSGQFKNEKKTGLTSDEQKLFIDYLLQTEEYKRWYPIFMFMLETGLRVGEATALTINDVNLKANYVSVDHTLVYFDKVNDDHSCTYEIHSTKTKNGRRLVPLTAKAKEAVLMELNYQKETGIKSKSSINGYENFLFVNRFGEVLNHGTLNKALHRIQKDCNETQIRISRRKNPVLLPKFSCHTLRHTFATRLTEADIHPKAAQGLLGHADIATTMDIYTDRTNTLLNDAIRKYENYNTSTE